ncbi:MAG: hypothetical protein J0L81_11260 [Caulobacterales bacterium]|jgi:hypothetical protein|nr:hypothetical protein [Caulobacterales bacterium]
MRALIISGFLALSALAACQTPPPAPVPQPAPAPAPPPAAACPIVESRNWAAWVNRMPGPDARPMLHVTGEIDLPHAGYRVEVREGPADRSATPVQQIVLELTQRSGMHAQIVTTAMVAYQGPAIAQHYRGVRVMCGGQVVANITEVVDAH